MNLLNGNVLIVENAGYGTTPACPSAQFVPGDIVKISRRKALAHFSAEAVVIGVIPPGISAEYALADLLGEPRPLLVTVGKRRVRYILANEGDKRSYLVDERDLRPSGKERVDIGSVKRAEP